MTNFETITQILENHFELIKFYFQSKISSPVVSDSEFETLSKNVFNQLSVNLRAQVTEKEFLHFCKLNKSRLLDLTQNV